MPCKNFRDKIVSNLGQNRGTKIEHFGLSPNCKLNNFVLKPYKIFIQNFQIKFQNLFQDLKGFLEKEAPILITLSS